MPPTITPDTRYFATLPIDDEAELEVSLFTSIATEIGDDRFLTRNINAVKAEDSAVVQFVVHPRSCRTQKDGLESEYSAQPLIVGHETPEIQDDSNGDHKAGGTPCLFRSDVIETVATLLADGYLHFLQFSYPGPDDAGEGEWVLANYSLNVFAKPEVGNFRFRYVLT